MFENEKIKLTGVIFGAVLFMAYIKQYIYYWYFNIDISEFIEIQGLFTPFLDDLIFNIVLILFTPIAIKHLINFLFNVNTNQKKDEVLVLNSEGQEIKKGNLKKELWDSLIYKTPIYSFFILQAENLYEYYNNENWFLFNLAIVYIFTFIIFMIGTTRFFKSNYVRSNPKEIINASFLVIFILIILSIRNFFSVMSEIKHKDVYEFKSKQYRFTLNHYRELKTDSTHLYLGRTKEKFFIHNKLENKTTVYNTSDIITEDVIELK